MKINKIISKSRAMTMVSAAIALMCAVTACRTLNKVVTESAVDGVAKEWSYLYTPVSVSLKKPMSMSFSGRATMERGKYVYISMRLIGMEVAVAYLDPDSVYFVDKYHKYLFAEPLKDILGQRYQNLTVADIQDIILGQKDFKISGSGFNVKQSDFVQTNFGKVAESVNLNANLEQGAVDALFEWKIGSAVWNDSTRVASFKMPSNCRRIPLENVKSMFKNMSF